MLAPLVGYFTNRKGSNAVVFVVAGVRKNHPSVVSHDLNMLYKLITYVQLPQCE